MKQSSVFKWCPLHTSSSQREKQNESADGIKSARVMAPPEAQEMCESFRHSCACEHQSSDNFTTPQTKTNSLVIPQADHLPQIKHPSL